LTDLERAIGQPVARFSFVRYLSQGCNPSRKPSRDSFQKRRTVARSTVSQP